jgi:hypothetical protein
VFFFLPGTEERKRKNAGHRGWSWSGRGIPPIGELTFSSHTGKAIRPRSHHA